MFRKKSVLVRKREKLLKELSSVNSGIRTLAKSIGSKTAGRGVESKPAAPFPAGHGHTGYGDRQSSPGATLGTGAGAGAQAPGNRRGPRKGIQPQLRDERFMDYLASSVDAMRPLRHERRIQRNKAILMLVLLVLVIFWALYRYFIL